MRFAYADPPYIGQAKKHYGNHPDYAGEVDQEALIASLVADYPDGWALSCGSKDLRFLLPLCPEGVRVMSWVKPFAIFKSANPAYAWEPVLMCGGRKWGRDRETVRDWVSEPIVLWNRHDPNHTVGTKPLGFCYWLFDALGIDPEEDTLDDLFPGSGNVARAFDAWRAQPRLPLSNRDLRKQQLGLDDGALALKAVERTAPAVPERPQGGAQ